MIRPALHRQGRDAPARCGEGPRRGPGRGCPQVPAASRVGSTEGRAGGDAAGLGSVWGGDGTPPRRVFSPRLPGDRARLPVLLRGAGTSPRVLVRGAAPPPPTPTRVPWLVLVGDHEGEGDFCPGGQLHVPGHRGEHPGRRRGGRRRPQKGERCFPPCAERPQSHHVPGGLQGPTRGTWRWPQRGVGMRGLCAQWGASVGPRSHPSTPGCCGGGGIHTPQSSPRLSWKTCRPQNK